MLKSESGNITVSEKSGTVLCPAFSRHPKKMLRKNLRQMSLLFCCFVKYVQEHLFQHYQQKWERK